MSLPTPHELMLPTLRAVQQIGGSGRSADIDAATLQQAGITPEQLAVEFEESASGSGPKVLHRIAWARSMLKRIEALESAGHGEWAITAFGEQLSEYPDDLAEAKIGELVRVAYQPTEPSHTQLSTFQSQAAAGDPVRLTVRELLNLWGVNRRRTQVVEKVRSRLGAFDLTTDPDFTLVSLDTKVALTEAVPTASTTEETSQPKATASLLTHEGLTVGNIPSSTAGVLAVSPDDDLLVATTHMLAHDYSQLAVMEGEYKLNGAITWESIAKTGMLTSNPTVRKCLDTNAVEVPVDHPLLAAVATIAKAGFVFVRGLDNRVAGIITTADLTDQFALLTRPFLLIGEIESVIRSAVNRGFSPSDLLEALNPDDEREVSGAESLTLGELQRFLSTDEAFTALGWPADRKAFMQKLDTVRRCRNDVMHFSPDPVSAEDVRLLETFLDFVQFLESNPSKV